MRSSTGTTAPSPLRVVPIRTFTKSRRGCRTCKGRKVKCDEKRPLCGNCARRFKGLKCCDFDPLVGTTSRGKKLNPTASSMKREHSLLPLRPSLTLSANCTPNLSDRTRVLELRLMHHYSTTTCRAMPGSNSSQQNFTWSVDIPQLAFYSDLVLSALLGISALHLSALVPQDQKLAYLARHYFDKAISQHRVALGRVENHNAEALLAAAILICHHTWISESTTVHEDYKLPLQTYYMARGIQVLFDQMWPALKNSGYLWYVEQQPVVDVGIPTSPDPFLIATEQDLAILSRTFEDPEVPAENREIYEKAVTEIISVCYAISNNAPQSWIQSRVATMPIRLPPLFLGLVELRDPRALALLARNLSLMKVITHVWWLHGTGKTQQVAKRAISGIESLMPSKWLWTMEWPLKVITSDERLCE